MYIWLYTPGIFVLFLATTLITTLKRSSCSSAKTSSKLHNFSVLLGAGVSNYGKTVATLQRFIGGKTVFRGPEVRQISSLKILEARVEGKLSRGVIDISIKLWRLEGWGEAVHFSTEHQKSTSETNKFSTFPNFCQILKVIIYSYLAEDSLVVHLNKVWHIWTV